MRSKFRRIPAWTTSSVRAASPSSEQLREPQITTPVYVRRILRQRMRFFTSSSLRRRRQKNSTSPSREGCIHEDLFTRRLFPLSTYVRGESKEQKMIHLSAPATITNTRVFTHETNSPRQSLKLVMKKGQNRRNYLCQLRPVLLLYLSLPYSIKEKNVRRERRCCF